MKKTFSKILDFVLKRKTIRIGDIFVLDGQRFFLYRPGFGEVSLDMDNTYDILSGLFANHNAEILIANAMAKISAKSIGCSYKQVCLPKHPTWKYAVKLTRITIISP